MNELEELERFRTHVPPPTTAARASAKAALDRAMAAEDTRLGRIIDDRPRTHAPRVVGVGAAAAVLVAAILVAAVTMVATSLFHGGGAPARTHLQGSTPGVGAAHLRLDAYDFTLPAGFRPRPQACMPTASTTQGIGTTVRGAIGSAAAAAGGCLEVTLAAGALDGPPVDALAIEVAAYRGFLTSDTNGAETLFVGIPAAKGMHYLVLTSSTLTGGELVAIATSGLPSSPSPSRPCTRGCG